MSPTDLKNTTVLRTQKYWRLYWFMTEKELETVPHEVSRKFSHGMRVDNPTRLQLSKGFLLESYEMRAGGI